MSQKNKGTWKCGDCGTDFQPTIEKGYEYGVCPHCKELKVRDQKGNVWKFEEVQAYYLEQLIREGIVPVDDFMSHNWNKPIKPILPKVP